MNKSAELLAKLAKPVPEKDLLEAKMRQEGKKWLELSRRISLSMIYYLNLFGMSQKELAERLNVAPSYIARLLKGKENFTLETITKIEDALNVRLLYVNTPYDKQIQIEFRSQSRYEIALDVNCGTRCTDNLYYNCSIHNTGNIA